MTKKSNQVIVIVSLIIAVGWLVFYFAYKPGQKASSKLDGSRSTIGQSVNDLINQTARQENPSNQTTQNTSSNSSKNTKISSACIDQQSQTFSCYEDYYSAVVKANGVAAAFADLKVRYNQNPYIVSQCHPITHVIGRTAAEIYNDVGRAYTEGDSYCWSGYYHGVMEGIVEKISVAQLPSKLNGICATIPGKASYSFDYYNCVHGLGHGVMAITNDELFDSLKLCDNLVGGWEQSSCHGGVFMENVIVDNKNHFTKYLKPSEPLYPCSAVDEKYKQTCYLMQTSYMLKVLNGDFSKVFELCSTVGGFADTCYQSLGRDASGRSVSNVSATKATCELGKDFDQKSNCIVGAVKDFVSYFHSDVQGKQLCAALETSLQSICYDTVKGYYQNF